MNLMDKIHPWPTGLFGLTGNQSYVVRPTSSLLDPLPEGIDLILDESKLHLIMKDGVIYKDIM